MGKALSADLRERLFGTMSEGMSRRAAAALFGVAASTAVRLQARYDETRSLQPAKQGCPAGRGKLAPYGDFIIAEVEKKPDLTLPKLAGLLEAAHQVRADPSSLSRFLCKHGFSYKKTLLASEQERADVKTARIEWRCWRQPAMRREPHRLLFIDETSVKTNMTPLRGRSRRGERLKADASFGRWHTQTFIAALREDCLLAPWVVNGAMNGEAFDTYVETQLAPVLREGDVVFHDDLMRLRTKNGPQNMATIRHTALNIIKTIPGKESQKVKRKSTAWNQDKLLAAITKQPSIIFKRLPCIIMSAAFHVIRFLVIRNLAVAARATPLVQTA